MKNSWRKIALSLVEKSVGDCLDHEHYETFY